MKKWGNILTGFLAGVCIMFFVGKIRDGSEEMTVESGMENTMESATEDMTGDTSENEDDVRAESDMQDGQETAYLEKRAFDMENYASVSDHMAVSRKFINELYLYQYIEYGIRKYNEATGQDKSYFVDVERNLLPYDTEFTMKKAGAEPYRTDLAKEMLPELAYTLYHYRLDGEDETLYMTVDTFGMKIYVYDGMESDSQQVQTYTYYTFGERGREAGRITKEPDLGKCLERFEEGMLDMPESFMVQLVLYQWLVETVEQYAGECGSDGIFYCDLEKDLMYGNKVFGSLEPEMMEHYTVPLSKTQQADCMLDNYRLMLEGTEETCYVDISIPENRIVLYLQWDDEKGVVWHTFGNERIKCIKDEETGQRMYSPDYMIENDWDDAEWVDGYFAGVSEEELHNLPYLKIPDNELSLWSQYLTVAGITKRYVEENQIEDVFYFDVMQDIVSNVVSGSIMTYRLRGQEHTLYIDVDYNYMRCHVYEVEELAEDYESH